MRFKIIFLILFIPVLHLIAQDNDSTDLLNFELSKNNINSSAMIVLGSWAALNIITGTTGNFTSKGESKYFHQFNAMWNTVNLAIAGFGYFNSINTDYSLLTNSQIVKDFSSLQSFLLLNAGLDVAYIATGLYLKEKSKSSPNNSDRLRGYGNSLLLQGGFLLLFDVGLYFIHQANADLYLYPVLNNQFADLGIGIIFKL